MKNIIHPHDNYTLFVFSLASTVCEDSEGFLVYEKIFTKYLV